jgi:Ca2+/Na+ antiporter
VSGFVLGSVICILCAAAGVLAMVFRVRLANAQGAAFDRRVGYSSKRRPGLWLAGGVFLIFVAVVLELINILYFIYELGLPK